MFEIESGIPIPPAKGKPRKYNLEDMQIGDSFWIPGVELSSVSGSISKGSRQLGIRCECRSLTESGVSGVRVWRTQ
jgi:hypothetical protein